MKTKHFLGMMASAWMLAACSNQDELLQQDGLMTEQRVAVNAYVPDGTSSRLTFDDQGTEGLKVAWKESGESFSVMTADEDNPVTVTFTQIEGSTFEGPDDFEFAEGTDYYAFYPKLNEEQYGEWNSDTGQPDLKVSATAIPFSISSQTGELDESMNLMYAKRSVEGDFQFQHMLAVMKFTLKGIQGKLVQYVDILLDDRYYTEGEVDVTEEYPTFPNDYSYSVVSIPAKGLTADDEGNYVVYAYLPPLAAGTEVSIEAYSEHEEYYKGWRDKFTVRNEGIEAGKYYTAARTMDAVPEKNISLNHTAGTVAELENWIKAVGVYSGVNLTLTGDINLTSVGLKYDNNFDGTFDSNWPQYGLSVSGTVDGGGHSITGIINLDEGFQASPFIIESTGVVKNLHFKNVNISGMYAGGIATHNYGTISGCSVSGFVTALASDYYAGGIVAINDGTVTGCYNMAEVKCVDYAVGGIAGYNRGTISACYNTGALSATLSNHDAYIGGIAGANGHGELSFTASYWACTGATNGIGFDYNTSAPSDEGAKKVDGTSVTWESAKDAMNAVLPEGFGWNWIENTDADTRTDIPLVLKVTE